LVFALVHWDGHERAFRHLPRFTRHGVAKLIHGLVNTNRQNHLLYGNSSLCPICQLEDETLPHVFTCSHPNAVANRQKRLDELYKDLETSGTPTKLIQAIQHGFSSWHADPTSNTTRALTAGSLYGPDTVLTTAFYEQVRHIGWYHMCLGRVSKKWALAAQHYDATQFRDGGQYWTSLLITALWCYSKMLWRFCNEVIHGSTIEEQTTLQLGALWDNIISLYHEYSENPNMILARHRSLFTSRSLEDRLNGSYDTMSAWVRSVKEAIAVLQYQEVAHRAASRVFFPSHVAAPDMEESDSTYSEQSISSDFTLSLDPTLPTVATTNTMSSTPSSHLGSSQSHFESNAEDYCSVLTGDSPAESTWSSLPKVDFPTHLTFTSDDEGCCSIAEPWEFSPFAIATRSRDVEESSVASRNGCINMGVAVNSDTSSEDVEQSSVASSLSSASSVSTSSGWIDT